MVEPCPKKKGWEARKKAAYLIQGQNENTQAIARKSHCIRMKQSRVLRAGK